MSQQSFENGGSSSMDMLHRPDTSRARPEADGASLTRDLMVIVGCQLAGEMTQQTTDFPIAGSVLGLLLLLGVLVFRRGPWDSLQSNARGLLKHLPLLFVPAGVGVSAHWPLIRAEWLPITAGILGSSVIAILMTAFAMRAVEAAIHRRTAAQKSGSPSLKAECQS